MGRWAALGIAAGLMGTACLSACSPDGGLKRDARAFRGSAESGNGR